MDIRIIVNKKDMTISNNTVVSSLLESLGYTKRVAIWVNGTQLLNSEYDSHILNMDDEIRIVRLVAGG